MFFSYFCMDFESKINNNIDDNGAADKNSNPRLVSLSL